MIQNIFANSAISISDLKRNPSAAIEAAGGAPVAILNHNRPSAYLVPVKAWEELMERLDDTELVKIVKERWDEPSIPVNLADL